MLAGMHGAWSTRHAPRLPRRPQDLATLREAEEARLGREGRSKKGKPFPYGDEVPPEARDWRAEGRVTPVKDQ